ncbi:hypothetical protein A2U01_0071957, partial [Trifolium medium]|nr:hypothetical protein [Trifolium medium]
GEIEALGQEYIADKQRWKEAEEQLTYSRNAYMVCHVRAEQDYMKNARAVSKLVGANTSLKKGMAIKYVEGFRSCMEQIKAVFPDLDAEKLSQVGVTKK